MKIHRRQDATKSIIFNSGCKIYFPCSRVSKREGNCKLSGVWQKQDFDISSVCFLISIWVLWVSTQFLIEKMQQLWLRNRKDHHLKTVFSLKSLWHSSHFVYCSCMNHSYCVAWYHFTRPVCPFWGKERDSGCHSVVLGTRLMKFYQMEHPEALKAT